MLTPTFMLVNVIMLAKTRQKSLAQTAGDTVIGSLGVLSSCLTNIWATSLVVLRTMKYRREIMKFLRNYRQGRLERVLMLLAESGILYCLFWIVLSVLSFAVTGNASIKDETSGLLVAGSIIFAGMAQLCGIYPTTIIVAVCLQGVTYHPRFLTEQMPGLDLHDCPISTELQFAAHGTRTQRMIPRRSTTVSVRLPVLSTDPESGQELHERLERDEDKKSGASSEPI